MEDSDFPYSNRLLLSLAMMQPYVDWAITLPDRSKTEIEKPLTTDEIDVGQCTYLIPEV